VVDYLRLRPLGTASTTARGPADARVAGCRDRGWPMAGATNLEAVIRERCATQHGLVTRSQLLAAGVADHVIERRVRSGRLVPLHRGVYQAGPVAGVYAQEMAAVLACGGECRISHRSAAGMWKLRPWDPDPPRPQPATEAAHPAPTEVTMRRTRRCRVAGVHVHRVRELASDEVTLLDRVPVTTPARTLLDLGECLGARDVEQALARAERNGLATRDVVRAIVKRHPRHRGARALRQILAPGEPAAFTRSMAEEALLALVRAAGLARPELNARVLSYEVDFFWRVQRLVVEVDGLAFHGSARAFVGDRRRDAELAAAGYRVMRFTWQDVTQSREATLVRLAQALVR
jgi:very-short-patch-repair endonuclease/predicted transcriptional regulator of viral defense system